MNNKKLTLGVVTSILVAAGMSSSAFAGDYRIPARGITKAPAPSGYASYKDTPMIMSSPGSCYLRADTGYAIATDPDSNYYTEIGATPTSGALGNIDRDGSWLFDVGVGCGTAALGGRFAGAGLRGDMTFGYRREYGVSGDLPGGDSNDTIKADIETYTQMFNIYKDFSGMGSLTPYVGAGIGMAYHDMGHVHAEHDGFTYSVEGDDDLQFAWSLMAGVSMKVTNSLSVDFGYRYIDMGDVTSGTDIVHIEGGAPADPRLSVEDLTSHELKIGLRYQLGR